MKKDQDLRFVTTENDKSHILQHNIDNINTPKNMWKENPILILIFIKKFIHMMKSNSRSFRF